MKETAKEKLIAAAEAEMLAKGFPATTVDEICARAGVSKGSFYHFFSTKEELGLAALEAFFARNLRVVQQAPGGGSPKAQAAALVDHLLASAGRMWGGGCLLGSLALDLAETHPQVAEEVSAKFRAMAGLLAAGFAPLAEDLGELWSGEALAEQFIVAVEGGLILARAHGDWGYVERALARFRHQVLSARP
jgi:TetR/AcrR family transcriptional repressor of nem operon